MPQFDTFIFSSSLFYLLITFFLLLTINFTRLLPRLSAIMKLRHKIKQKSTTKNVLNLPFTSDISIFGEIISNSISVTSDTSLLGERLIVSKKS